jgi:hypothetical protein
VLLATTATNVLALPVTGSSNYVVNWSVTIVPGGAARTVTCYAADDTTQLGEFAAVTASVTTAAAHLSGTYAGAVSSTTLRVRCQVDNANSGPSADIYQMSALQVGTVG